MKTRYRSTIGLLTAVLVIILLLPCLTAFDLPAAAYAAGGTDVAFDDTDVMDDLEGSALNGVPFDIADYPYNPEGELQILGFVEYCYSEYENLRGNYGLYIYIYNPALLDIATGTGSNRIQMGVEYNENGEVTRYDKFDLKVCSVSKGTAANRFWKFKVIDHEVNGTYFADRVSPYERRYDISGVEISFYGEQLPKEYEILRTYRYTGFAEGYGSIDERINCSVQDFEGIELDVRHSSFLANVAAAGKGHYNQVHTAYFAVPEYFFENYGRLQKILAEWYEYKLAPMLVTANSDLYNLASKYTAYQLNGQYDDYVPYWLWYGLDSNDGLGQTHIRTTNEWSFNVEDIAKFDPMGQWSEIRTSLSRSSIIPLVFYSEVNDPYEIFKALNRYKTAGDVAANELLESIYVYKNTLGHGYIDILERRLSADLFTESVDEGRIKGYQKREVDFDDTFNLNSYWNTTNWFEKLYEFGLRIPDFGDDYKNVRPIYEVQDTDFLGSNEQIAKNLLINELDVDALKAYYNAQVKEGNRVILFRFAVTDYMSRPIGYETMDGIYNVYENKTDSYICQETVFFNFDVIQLTFNRDGEYRAFAVVSDPVDIVGNLEPPYTPGWADDLEDFGQSVKDFFERIGEWFRTNWKWIVLAVGIVLGLIILALVVKLIVGLRGNKTSTTINLIDGSKSGSGKSSVKVKRKKKKGGGS